MSSTHPSLRTRSASACCCVLSSSSRKKVRVSPLLCVCTSTVLWTCFFLLILTWLTKTQRTWIEPQTVQHCCKEPCQVKEAAFQAASSRKVSTKRVLDRDLQIKRESAVRCEYCDRYCKQRESAAPHADEFECRGERSLLGSSISRYAPYTVLRLALHMMQGRELPALKWQGSTLDERFANPSNLPMVSVQARTYPVSLDIQVIALLKLPPNSISSSPCRARVEH